MIQKGLASVLVPVYNGERYLVEFLDSIKNQTYDRIQLIIRDDCSKDNSYKICNDWMRDNKKFFYDSMVLKAQKNGGLSQNVSILSTYAKGEFIFLADQDDVWKNNKIAYQVQYMEQHPNCIISLSDRSITDDKLNIKEISNYAYAGYKIKSMDFKEVIKHRAAYAANAMCIRNGEYNIFDLPNNVVSHDTFITVMASCYGSIDFLYEPLLLYRIHKNNISGNYISYLSSNFFECFIRYLKVSRRGIQSYKWDSLVIEQELKNRFNIELREYNNAFFRKYEKSIVKHAWLRTMNAYKSGNIGIWHNK